MCTRTQLKHPVGCRIACGSKDRGNQLTGKLTGPFSIHWVGLTHEFDQQIECELVGIHDAVPSQRKGLIEKPLLVIWIGFPGCDTEEGNGTQPVLADAAALRDDFQGQSIIQLDQCKLAEIIVLDAGNEVQR